MKKAYLLVSSDWHCSAAGAVMAPGTKIKISGNNEPVKTTELELNPIQVKLWNLTRRVIETVKKVAGDDPIVFAQVGDICNGNEHSEQMVQGGARLANQWAIAFQYFAALYAALPNIAEFYTVYGTDCHSSGDGSSEEQVSQAIYTKFGIRSEALEHGMVDIGGALVDIAHHGPSVGRAWTQDNPIRPYLLRQMMDDMDVHGKSRPADLYIRGHVHGYGWATAQIERRGMFHKSQCFVIPSMYKINTYARKVSRSASYSRHGFVMIEIFEGGTIGRSWPMLETYDARDYRTSGVLAYNKGNASQGDGMFG